MRKLDRGMRRETLVKMRSILLWALAVIAVVFGEAMWFAQPD